MNDRPPPSRAAIRQRRYRARGRANVVVYSVSVGPLVLEALIARAIDAGLSAEVAERDSRDRRKINAELSDVIAQWARTYIDQRKRNA